MEQIYCFWFKETHAPLDNDSYVQAQSSFQIQFITITQEMVWRIK